MVGIKDKFGVQASYSTKTNIKYDFRENFRSDGLRFDFEGIGSGYASAELIGYFACGNPPDDEVSGKMGGGRHSSGSRPRVYDMGIDCRNGNTRYRTEDFHPEYDEGDDGGKGVGMSSKYIGYKFIKWNKSNGVLLEIWQDTGNNESTPANAWKKIASWLVTDPKWFTPPGDHQETIRIDQVDTGDLKWKWLSLREIGTSDTDTGGGGTDGGGDEGECIPPGTGGGGGGGSGGGVAGDCSKTLYKLTGKTMNFQDTGYKERHYASGKPDSVTREWNANNCPYENYEVTFYVTIKNPDDDSDDISVKCYGPRHQDGQGAWYIFDVEFDTGKTGWGWEQPHPDTEAYTDVGTSVGSIIGKRIGIKTAIWKRSGGGAHCVGYVDKGDKVWKKVIELDNPDGKKFSRDSEQQVQIRIDACPNIEMHCLSLKEIVPNGELDPSTNTTVPTTSTDPVSPTFPSTPKVKAFVRGNGPIYSAPNCYVIFDDADYDTTTNWSKQDIIDDIQTIQNSTYYDALLQYGCKKPKSWHYIVNTTKNLPSTWHQDHVKDIIEDSKSRGLVPSNTPVSQKNIYIVIGGKGKKGAIKNSDGSLSTNIGGFNWSYASDNSSQTNYVNSATVIIAVLPRTREETTETLFHELVEQMTSPMSVVGQMAWRADNNVIKNSAVGALIVEIGDAGEGLSIHKINGVGVESYYSNQDGDVVPPPNSPSWLSCPSGTKYDYKTQMCITSSTSTPPTQSETLPKLSTPKDNKMVYHGGPVWSSAVCHFIFAGKGGTSWSNVSNPSRSQIMDELKKHFAYPASRYYDGVIQYNVRRPILGNMVTNENTNISDSYGTSEIFDVIYDAIQKGQVPARDKNVRHMYYVITKPGKYNQFGPSGGGWHTYSCTDVNDPYATSYIIGTAIHRDLDAMMGAISHEVVSMITNPCHYPISGGLPKKGWVADPNQLDIQYGEELPDVCAISSVSDDGAKARGYPNGASIVNDVFVANWYSNQHGGCQASKSAPTFISCPTGSTWDDKKQSCVSGSSSGGDGGGGGGGTTNPPPSTTPPNVGECEKPVEWDYGGVEGSIEEGIPIGLIEFKQISVVDNITGEIVVIGWDSNFDGNVDAWDENADGIIDAIDTNYDGKPDVFDTDGDGRAESFDTDGDGIIDKTGNLGIGEGAGQGTGGGGLGSGTGSGGFGSGINSPSQEQPKPINYVAKQFPIIYAIDVMNMDACSIDLPEEIIEPIEIFEAAGDNLWVETRNFRKVGLLANTDNSILVGKKLREIKVIMKKGGEGATITGNVYCRIRAGVNETIVEEFDTVLDSSMITGNEQEFTFKISRPSRKFIKGDIIYIEYPKGEGSVNDTIGGNADNYLMVKITEKDKTDSIATCLNIHDGNASKKFVNNDLACKIYA